MWWGSMCKDNYTYVNKKYFNNGDTWRYLYTLTAYPVQQIAFTVTGYNPSVILQLFLTLLVSIPLAFLSWKFVEKPFINLNRRYMKSINSA